MTTHWKAVEQYFTDCNFGIFVNVGLGTGVERLTWSTMASVSRYRVALNVAITENLLQSAISKPVYYCLIYRNPAVAKDPSA